MRGMVLGILLLLLLAPVHATVLSDAAAQLGPGQSIRFVMTDQWDARKNIGGTTQNIDNYAQSMIYDPFADQIRMVGKDQGPDPHYMMVYDEATNAWCSNPALGGFCEAVHADLSALQSGHGYDNNAFDPATGNHYYLNPGIGGPGVMYLFVYNDATGWEDPPRAKPSTAQQPSYDSITWFPELNGGAGGLVIAQRRGNKCQYSNAAVTSWQLCTANSISMPYDNGYHMFSEYLPSIGKVVFGGGNNDAPHDLKFWILNADGSYDPLMNLPFYTGNNVEHAQAVANPADDQLIIFQDDNTVAGRDWRQYDVSEGAWSSLLPRTGSSPCSGSTPVNTVCDGVPYLGSSLAISDSSSSLVLSLEEYGVILILPNDAGAKSKDEAWLYKHTASTPPVCGDGVAQGSEQCDGADLRGASCVSLGYVGGSLSCTGACAYDESACVAPVCGNGVIEGSEVCDGAALGGETCVSQGFSGGSLACNAGCTGYDTSACAAPPAAPIHEFVVHDYAGEGATDWPVSAVLPLEYGAFSTTSSFRVWDVTHNAPVPAQFEVLERWVTKDNSIRHVIVHFQTTVSPGGTTTYRLTSDGPGAPPAEPVTVTGTGSGTITVTTGPLRFTVDEDGGTIIDTVRYDLNGDRAYATGEQIIDADPVNHGGRFMACDRENVAAGNCGATEPQHDVDLRSPWTVTVEEAGPMRAVIRLEALTRYNDADNDHVIETAGGEYHEHGAAIRIYAYAGRPDIKVDYQVQNSAKGPALWGGKWANPLYFDSLDLEFGLNLGASVTATAPSGDGASDTRSVPVAGYEHAATLHDERRTRTMDEASTFSSCSDGATDLVQDCDDPLWLSVEDGSWGVQAVIRNGWELWPSGIAIDSSDTLQVQLFPDWSGSREKGLPAVIKDFYWLDDMNHIYKEVLFSFHGSATAAELAATAANFDRAPVAILPTESYDGGTTELAGRNPRTAPYGSASTTDDWYQATSFDENHVDSDGSSDYMFGVHRWYNPDDNEALIRNPCAPGGGPPSAEHVYATESPADYYRADAISIAEMNLRPQWMAGYDYDTDYAVLGLTQNGYCAGNWRAQNAGTSNNEVYIPGTTNHAKARDIQHGWLYHLYQAYWVTGNPWIRDWMAFHSEFRRPYFNGVEPTPDNAPRSQGHILAAAWYGYRATGDTTYIDEAVAWMRDTMRPTLSKQCGRQVGNEEWSSSFMVGFLAQGALDVLEEYRPDGVGNGDWGAWGEVFEYVSGWMEWMRFYGRYGYQVDDPGGVYTQCNVGSGSAGGSWTVPDPAMRYYWLTGKDEYKADAQAYVGGGLDGGSSPYKAFDMWPTVAEWTGQRAGRTYYWVGGEPRPDATPPPAPSNVVVIDNGDDTATVTWDAAPGAAYYFVVLSDVPLVECTSGCPSDATSTDTVNYRNWWAAETVAATASSSATAIPLVNLGSADNLYAAVFAFDASDNMGPMSVVASETPAVCGNGVVEPGEQCDGAALGGASCVSLGYVSGSLGCTGSCTYDTGACVSPRCDEHPLYNTACTSGLGVCAAGGTYACVDPASTAEVPSCDATPGTPGTEVCGNSLDDDCDGSADEGCGALFQFDFDCDWCATRETAPGWTSILPATTYSPGGYGWSSGSINTRDRGSSDPVGRDFNSNIDSHGAGTFLVDLDPGTYELTFSFQDAPYPGRSFDLYAEGNLLETITVTSSLVSYTYQVEVADGQLEVHFPATGDWSVNGLEIASLGGGLLTCAEQSGNECSGFYACPVGSELSASDTAACCSVACVCANTGDLNCDGIVNVFDLVRAGSPQDRPANWLDILLDVFSNFGREY